MRFPYSPPSSSQIISFYFYVLNIREIAGGGGRTYTGKTKFRGRKLLPDLLAADSLFCRREEGGIHAKKAENDSKILSNPSLHFPGKRD